MIKKAVRHMTSALSCQSQIVKKRVPRAVIGFIIVPRSLAYCRQWR